MPCRLFIFRRYARASARYIARLLPCFTLPYMFISPPLDDAMPLWRYARYASAARLRF